MKQTIIYFILLGNILYVACLNQHRVEPAYPQNVSGWKGVKDKNGSLSRSFVLEEGKTTDNGKIQIKVVSIKDEDLQSETGSFERQARATIKITRLSDDHLLCEDIYPERGGGILTPKSCGSSTSDIFELENHGISGISVPNINVRNKWVFFYINGISK